MLVMQGVRWDLEEWLQSVRCTHLSSKSQTSHDATKHLPAFPESPGQNVSAAKLIETG